MKDGIELLFLLYISLMILYGVFGLLVAAILWFF